MRQLRDSPHTVIMSAELWDSLVGGRDTRYVDPGARARARLYVESVVGPAAARYAEAQAEHEARMPKLTNATKRSLGRQLRTLLKLHRNGTLNVDHLGRGEDAHEPVGGFEITLIPHTAQGGLPAIHFSRQPDMWFAGEVEPLHAEEREWVIKLVKRHRHVVNVWNDDGPWVSISFSPPKLPRPRG